MSGAGVPNLSPRISRRFTKATRLFATGSPPYLKRSPICPKMDLPMPSPANTLSVPPVRYSYPPDSVMMLSMPDWSKMNAAVFSGT